MKPSIGRIIHVFLENGQIRPAIVTRVGPAKVAHERVEGEAWTPGDWSWPPRGA